MTDPEKDQKTGNKRRMIPVVAALVLLAVVVPSIRFGASDEAPQPDAELEAIDSKTKQLAPWLDLYNRVESDAEKLDPVIERRKDDRLRAFNQSGAAERKLRDWLRQADISTYSDVIQHGTGQRLMRELTHAKTEFHNVSLHLESLEQAKPQSSKLLREIRRRIVKQSINEEALDSLKSQLATINSVINVDDADREQLAKQRAEEDARQLAMSLLRTQKR